MSSPDPDGGLGDAGLKSTQGRRRVLAMLNAGGERHRTAEDLFRALLAEGQEVPLATIYRVLGQLERAGIVRRSRFVEGGQAVYELDDGVHHDHMVCVRCGRVAEFSDEAIERRQRTIAAQRGFELVEHRQVLFGLCSASACADPPPRAGGHPPAP